MYVLVRLFKIVFCIGNVFKNDSIFFPSDVMEAGSSEFLEDPIDIDVKYEKVENVEEHNSAGYINTKFKKIIKCSECAEVLPNDQKAIKSHMMNHILVKQKSVVIGGASKKKPMPSKPFLTK